MRHSEDAILAFEITLETYKLYEFMSHLIEPGYPLTDFDKIVGDIVLLTHSAWIDETTFEVITANAFIAGYNIIEIDPNSAFFKVKEK